MDSPPYADTFASILQTPPASPQPQQYRGPSLDMLRLNPDEFPRYTHATILQRYPLPLVVGPATNQGLEEWVIDINIMDWLGPKMRVIRDNETSKELVFSMELKRPAMRENRLPVIPKEGRGTPNVPVLNLPESMASIAATVSAKESGESNGCSGKSRSPPVNHSNFPNHARANFRGRDVPYHLSALADSWFNHIGIQTTMSIFVPKVKDCREEQQVRPPKKLI
jgi:hypothetical protein